MTPANVANQLAIDVNSLAQTKRLAREDPRAALKNAAQQFEAVFLQMVLKSMRDASPAEGMFDSAQSRMYQSMLDQQLAQT
ncbi:MAG: flagellar assembly peptidoglycan hydrolase FlgJ, partial [Rhodocyclales bacterium]